MDAITKAAAWANENEGVVSILIFTVTLFLAWVSGIFQSLRRRPKFKLGLIPGPTLCCTFVTGEMRDGYPIHRTALSLYLKISNVGSAASSVENVSVAYHWHLRPISWNWIKYRVLWFWLHHPAVTMEDFQYNFGEKIKVYPSLFQGSATLGHSTETYLDVGRTVNGIVYFEQNDSWGGCFPSVNTGTTKVRVAVTDSFGRKHKKTFRIPVMPLAEAKKYNPSFGGTYETLRQPSQQGPEIPNPSLNTDTPQEPPRAN